MLNENENKIDVDLILDPPNEWEDDEKIYFGEISLEDDTLNELTFDSNANFGGKARNCEIYIHKKNEGPIAHFHVENMNNGFSACVKIYKNEYFKHNRYLSEFNATQKKKFDSWMDERKSKSSLTNWERISAAWVESFGKPNDYTTIRPNYLNL